MEQLVFLVKGSSSEPYELTFIKDGDSLTALCSCPAGTFGNLCKHRVSILDGQTESVSSDYASKVSTVTDWLVGTDVEAALTQLRDAQNSSEASKDDLAALKRKLARAMNS